MNKKLLEDARKFLKTNVTRELLEYYGVTDKERIDYVANNYFKDEENYDCRWGIIDERAKGEGRILDMAAGCGTFLLYGLNNGRNVWGVEPEMWKHEYFRMKVKAACYPDWYMGRMIPAFGESLPFSDGEFDLVTTYQTLEHVEDFRRCIGELLRVLKPGGVLWIKAPDYDCFWEPHYLVPFLPKMDKRLARPYLKLIGRPLKGLEPLKWTTSEEVERCCEESGYRVNIDNRSWIRPFRLRHLLNRRVLKQKAMTVGRTENQIDLWIKKLI